MKWTGWRDAGAPQRRSGPKPDSFDMTFVPGRASASCRGQCLGALASEREERVQAAQQTRWRQKEGPTVTTSLRKSEADLEASLRLLHGFTAFVAFHLH